MLLLHLLKEVSCEFSFNPCLFLQVLNFSILAHQFLTLLLHVVTALIFLVTLCDVLGLMIDILEQHEDQIRFVDSLLAELDAHLQLFMYFLHVFL